MTRNVNVFGAGQVGIGIVRYLTAQGCRIVLIDTCKDTLKNIEEKMDIQTICGIGTYPKILKKSYIQGADLFIAVTESDENNILSCAIAKQLSKHTTTIARVRHHQYGEFPKTLGVDSVISPEVEVARLISKSIKIFGSFDFVPLFSKEIQIIGLHCAFLSPILDKDLSILSATKQPFVVLLIQRDDKTFIPSGSDQIKRNDYVYVMVHFENLLAITELFGYKSKENQRVLILGGGNIGLTLTQHLHEEGLSIVIIEKDNERARKIASLIPYGEILCADALDKDSLLEAGTFDTSISVTNEDQVNILSSLLAKRIGITRSLCLLNNNNYNDLVTSLGIDGIINPNAITIASIYQRLLRGVCTYPLSNEAYAIIEAIVHEDDGIVGLNSYDIDFDQSIFLAALIQENKCFLLPKQQTIKVGDRVILCIRQDSLHRMDNLFSNNSKYLKQ